MRPVEPQLPAETILALFDYNPETGDLWWKIKQGRVVAGTIVLGDYVKISGKSYVTARVAWCVCYGEWPPLDRLVEHENRIHADNRKANMRLATYQQNAQNKAGHGSLAKGVYRRNRYPKSWAAKIMLSGKSIELGSFATHDEAAKAYRQAAVKYHGEFACLE